MVGGFPKGFEPVYPDDKTFTRWVELAASVEGRDPHAIRAFYDETGRVLGWLDVRGAAGGCGIEALVGAVTQRDITTRPNLSTAECCTLLAHLRALDLNLERGEDTRALTLLEAALDQPRLADLIFWHKGGQPLDDGEIVALAQEYKGVDLDGFLHPQAAWPSDRSPPSSMRYPTPEDWIAARELLVRLSEQEAIELAQGESTGRDLAIAWPSLTAGALGEWLISHGGICDVYADDERLGAAFRALAR